MGKKEVSRRGAEAQRRREGRDNAGILG